MSVRDIHGRLELGVRRTKDQRHEALQVDRLVIATGPDSSNLLDYQNLLRSMRDSGYLVPDPLGLGIACDDHCRAISAAGLPQSSLIIAGPLTRGTYGEITGVPEIAAQAVAIADTVIRQAGVSRRTISITR